MNYIKKIRLFYYSALHTSPEKLLQRLKLILKRKVSVFLFKNYPFIGKRKKILKRNNDFKKNSTNSSEKFFKKTKSGFVFKFLNQKYSFNYDFDWHKNELNEGTRLWKLNLHYFHWIVNASDEDFKFFINDWIEKNKPYQKNYWLDSWNSYALSIRVYTWINEISKREKNLDSDFIEKTNLSIINQINFLCNNLELDIGGNHIIKNIKALYCGSSFFKGKLPNKWRKLANRLLKKEINNQILNDGFHYELSPAYHCQVFEDLIDCYILLEESPLKEELEDKIYSMMLVIKAFTHPDNQISLFNDGGLNMAKSPKELFKIYNNIFKTNTSKSNQPLSFDNAGYYVVKNDLFHLIYDSGNVGPDELPAHSHGDIFSFELSVKDQRVFVDAGVFEYNEGEKRNLSRSTISHNTLTIEDADQCEFWSSFRMARRANVEIKKLIRENDNFYIKSCHNGYRHFSGEPFHQRELKCSENGDINIVDSVIGGKKQSVSSRLLLHPDIQIELKDSDKVILKAKSFNIQINSSKKNISIQPAFWWPNFGEQFETKRIIFDHGLSPCNSEIKISIKET